MVKKTKSKNAQLKAMIAAVVANSNIPRGVSTIHMQRVSVPPVSVGAPTVSDKGYGFSFQISDLPNVADLTSAYDFFSIDKVEVELHLMEMPRNNATMLGTGPLVILAPDYDDAIAPTAWNDLFEYGKNCNIVRFSSDKVVVKTTIKPRVSNTVYRTGVTSAYTMAQAGTLVDCANADTPHYGLKMWIGGYNTTSWTGGSIFMFVRYYLRLVANR